MATAVYFSIGSNAVNAAQLIQKAVNRILSMEGAREIARGKLYKTQPQGVINQPWFINTALAVWLDMGPLETLKQTKAIEMQLGRTPGERWGPREIDIDIIFHGLAKLTTDELTIPHPLAAQRRFVLAPLADIDPGLVHPALGRTVEDLLSALPEKGQEVYPIEP